MQILTDKIMVSVCLISLALPVRAQQGARAIFSFVPPLNRDGSIPVGANDRFVFVNPPTNEIVVSYVDPQNPGQRKTFRFGMHNQIDPTLTASVIAQVGGLYKYDYVLQNGGKARKKLKSWSLSVGSADPQLSAKHPLWAISSGASSVTRPGSIRPETALTWVADAQTRLGQGQPFGGFEVISRYKPGLAIAYAKGEVDVELADDIVRSLPKQVRDQLNQVLQSDWDTVQVNTIGPKYSTSDPKSLIASDFYRNLKLLEIVGTLKANSPFFVAAIASLESYLKSPGSNKLSPPLDYLNKASTGLESEIAAAMRLSL